MGSGVITLLFMGAYIRILQAEYEAKEIELNQALQVNNDWDIAWDNLQAELNQRKKEAEKAREKAIKIERDFNKLRLKQEKHDYAKIMQKKPGAVSRAIIDSTNRMFRDDEDRTQTYYNKARNPGTP